MDFGLKFTNHGDLLNTIDQWIDNRRQNPHRLLLVVTTDTPVWLKELAHLGNIDYISDQSGADRSDRIAALLGSERNSAVIALAQKPDLGLIAATAGTIKAGGLLVLGVKASRSSYSLRRLLSLIKQLASEHPACAAHIIAASESTSSAETSFAAFRPTINHGIGSSSAKPAQDLERLNSNALTEQNALLSKAIEHICSSQRCCVAITGARGRGKSTLLARLAKHFDNKDTEIAVTTQNKLALGSWTQHVSLAERWFLAPEKAATQTGTLLFVDEAANFPLATIQRFLDNFCYVVLASTVDGYESGGRALDIRLLDDQSHSNNNFLKLKPQEPWRWSANDPLETLISRLLLNQKTEAVNASRKNINAAELQIKRITQQTLASDEALLASVFSLLQATHYQTSTKDLEHLLDATSLQIWAQMQLTDGCQRVAAVLLLEIEGEIEAKVNAKIEKERSAQTSKRSQSVLDRDEEIARDASARTQGGLQLENTRQLHEAIVSKARRLPNQLLPQLLAQSANTPVALHKRYGRVLRIAVLPEHRRCHLATDLLEVVIAKTRLDAIGASFAADERSTSFWQASDFQIFHRGFKNNPRTGKHAIAVMRCFESTSQAVLDTAIRIHRDNENSDETNIQESPSLEDVTLLQRFALGQRSMHDTRGAIRRLVASNTLPLERTNSQSRKEHELLLRKCVKEAINKV